MVARAIESSDFCAMSEGFSTDNVDTDTVNLKVDLGQRTFGALLDNIIRYLLSYKDLL